ncbi:MAG: TonB-dependent receptor [Bacteroidota bacterium]
MSAKFLIYGLTIQIIFFQMLLAANGNAQGSKNVKDVRISLALSGVDISQVFNAIESKTQYSFAYDPQDLPAGQKIYLDMEDRSVAEILVEVSRQSRLRFKQVNNTISVNKTTSSPEKEIEILVEQTISGQVTDLSTDEPLPGVNILAKGTSAGTVSDVDGNYRLTVADEVTTLVFSSIGYEKVEEFISGRSEINVSLSPDIQALTEVVVVGYGVVEKRDLTGSVAKVGGEEIQNIPSPRVDQLLQGRAPGVNVTSVSGEPGARASIRIRGGNSVQGDNEPLFVIDGFIAGTNFDLNSLNVNDIESIDVLKDASAISIYGTRGANGVILVTTKNGADIGEGKPEVSINAYTGIQSLPQEIEYLNGSERAQYGREYAEFTNETNPFTDDVPIANTNWQELITRDAPINNVDLSIRGNTKNTNYYISANFFDQRGIIDNSGLRRYNFRANLDFNLSEKLTFGTRLNVSFNKRDRNLVNLWNTRFALTSFPVFNEDGSFFDDNYVVGGPFDNPLATLAFNTNESFTTNLLGNFYLEFKPIDSLTIRSTLGPQIGWGKNNRFTSGRLPARIVNQQGAGARIANSFNIELLQENTIDYRLELDEGHQIQLLGGFTWQTSSTEVFSAETDGLPNDAASFDILELGNRDSYQINSDFSEPFQIVSWIGRANYSYQDKYLLTLSGRVDGSSRFASAENQYAFFPSVAAAWNLDQESFISDSEVFDVLKLRASYGRAGSQAIESFSTQALLGTDLLVFNNTTAIGASRLRPNNPELRWETTDQLDIGLEAGFFDSRLYVEVDYYHKTTNDLLLNRQIPSQTGFQTRLENIGSLQNQGIELLINTTNIDTKNFTWSSTLTLAGNRSKVLDLGEVDEIVTYEIDQGGPGSKLIVGEPVGIFTGLEYLGVFNTQEELDQFGYDGLRAVLGGARFGDTDGDGIISFNDDFVTIGDPEPIVFGGINNTFTWKNLSVDIFLQGTFGNDVYNEQTQRAFFGTSTANVYAEARDRWTPSNPESNIPRAGGSLIAANSPSNSELIEDGSHLRLRNLRVNYRIPSGENSWFKNLNIYLTGNNLFLLSNFRGYDPEASRIGPDSNQEFNDVVRGVIRAEYPNARSFTIGFNATL